MPAMSGFELAAKLKNLITTSHIPLIAMTGYYTFDERSFLMNICSLKKCLKKPLNPLDVIKEIEWTFKEEHAI